MKGIWRRQKVLVMAAGMVLCFTGALAAGMGLMRNLAREQVVWAAEKESEQDSSQEAIGIDAEDASKIYEIREWTENTPYQEAALDKEVAKAVCEKYELDYETVTMKDITREISNYEEALLILKRMGDAPLLQTSVSSGQGEDEGVSSLEIYIGDIYAFSGAEAVIRSVCETYEISAEESSVSDLTPEQIVEIGETAYETSDHPKE